MKKIILLVGASGSGKSTLVRCVKLCDKTVKELESYTTRPKRNENETGHKFVTIKQFDRLKNKIAYTEINGNKYCATEAQMKKSDIYVIDPHGIDVLLDTYKGDKEVIVAQLKCSRFACFLNMLKRGDSVINICKRIIHDWYKFSEENIMDIINEKRTEIKPQYIELNTSHPTDYNIKKILTILDKAKVHWK